MNEYVFTDDDLDGFHDIITSLQRMDVDRISETVDLVYKRCGMKSPSTVVLDSPEACQSYATDIKKVPIQTTETVLRDIQVKTFAEKEYWYVNRLRDVALSVRRIRDIPVSHIYDSDIAARRFSERIDFGDTILLFLHIVSEIEQSRYDQFLSSYTRSFLSSVPYCSIHYKDECIISQMPVSVSVNSTGVLHDTEKMAIRWDDGYGQYYVRGMYIENDRFESIKRGEITVNDILTEKNTEIRTAMLLLYGPERIINDGDARHVDSWTKMSGVTGEETSCELCEIGDMKFLSLEDHSTHKKTFLPVPPDVVSVKSAIAWTFNMEFGDYNCDIET